MMLKELIIVRLGNPPIRIDHDLLSKGLLKITIACTAVESTTLTNAPRMTARCNLYLAGLVENKAVERVIGHGNESMNENN